MRAARNTSAGLAVVAGLVVTTLLPTAPAAAAATTVTTGTQCPQPAISYCSPCAATWLGTLTTAGLCPVTALATLFGETISTVFEVAVHEAPLDTLILTTAAGSVRQGGSLTFTVSGTDAYGNPVDVSSARLTSSVPTDVVDGLTVTFPQASPHVITVTVGDVSSSVNAGASVDAGAALLALLSVLIGAGAVTVRRRVARRA